MLNKFDALRYFCRLADTLNFRETAVHFAISPPVVSRVIAELEEELGETLFKRNSRKVTLTPFGEQLLPQAQQLLADSEKLFKRKKQQQSISGVVRITALDLPEKAYILTTLLDKLADYPNIQIDWQTDVSKSDSIRQRIDIGIRSSISPAPNFIVRKIIDERPLIVASPEFIRRYGRPQAVGDLQNHYPFVGLVNPATGKCWPLTVNERLSFMPRHIKLTTNDPYLELGMTLSGQAFGQISELLCRPHLQQGRLIELFPQLDYQAWQLYLYRPYQVITSPAVLTVFEALSDILQQIYCAEPHQVR
ncbi:hypothetical protein OA57_08225 [Chelonobacter oris]|uniref:HTH lysR-type domain-containing protein n=1 Tax=Chelonobacter oris TaxID=505317 RepID=A0A0A3AL27_9PAST|nr:LysR family transcriptional regulator [Chelonobacter oris]KGQ70041.1 hypothetical protein OA57_08225 [Chelonobacter oris]